MLEGARTADARFVWRRLAPTEEDRVGGDISHLPRREPVNETSQHAAVRCSLRAKAGADLRGWETRGCHPRDREQAVGSRPSGRTPRRLKRRDVRTAWCPPRGSTTHSSPSEVFRRRVRATTQNLERNTRDPSGGKVPCSAVDEAVRVSQGPRGWQPLMTVSGSVGSRRLVTM